MVGEWLSIKSLGEKRSIDLEKTWWLGVHLKVGIARPPVSLFEEKGRRFNVKASA